MGPTLHIAVFYTHSILKSSLFILNVTSSASSFMCRELFLHLITLNDTHTHTLSRTPLDEGSAHLRDPYLTPYDVHTRQTSIPPAGFEPPIPASEQPQT
jgi:hypothetical protein